MWVGWYGAIAVVVLIVLQWLWSWAGGDESPLLMLATMGAMAWTIAQL